MGKKGEGWYWHYPTCAEWLSWEGLKALVWGLARMKDSERRALGVRIWSAPVVDTSQFGKELGLARTPSNRQQPGGRARAKPMKTMQSEVACSD
jgi:hypothetical protein